MKYHKLIIVAGLAMSLAHLSLDTQSTLTVGQTEVSEISSKASEMKISLKRCVAYDMSLTGRARRFFKSATNALISGPQPHYTGPSQALASMSIDFNRSLEIFDN